MRVVHNKTLSPSTCQRKQQQQQTVEKKKSGKKGTEPEAFKSPPEDCRDPFHITIKIRERVEGGEEDDDGHAPPPI